MLSCNQSQEPLFPESDTTAGLIFSMVERNGQNSTHGLDRKFLSCGLAQDVPSTGTACSFPRLRLLTMTFHHLDNYLVTFTSSEKATRMYNPFLVCNTSSGKTPVWQNGAPTSRSRILCPVQYQALSSTWNLMQYLTWESRALFYPVSEKILVVVWDFVFRFVQWTHLSCIALKELLILSFLLIKAQWGMVTYVSNLSTQRRLLGVQDQLDYTVNYRSTSVTTCLKT